MSRMAPNAVPLPSRNRTPQRRTRQRIGVKISLSITKKSENYIYFLSSSMKYKMNICFIEQFAYVYISCVYRNSWEIYFLQRILYFDWPLNGMNPLLGSRHRDCQIRWNRPDPFLTADFQRFRMVLNGPIGFERHRMQLLVWFGRIRSQNS